MFWVANAFCIILFPKLCLHIIIRQLNSTLRYFICKRTFWHSVSQSFFSNFRMFIWEISIHRRDKCRTEESMEVTFGCFVYHFFLTSVGRMMYVGIYIYREKV